MNMTDHFTYEEVIVTSRRGFSNFPPKEVLITCLHTAEKMEAVRALLDGRAIKVHSWYRSPALNKAVGGSKSSQHLKGEAVDFSCSGYGTPYEICQKLSMHKQILGIDQLIYEGTWVHVSFVIPPRVPRLEVLTYTLDKKYVPGLHLRKEV